MQLSELPLKLAKEPALAKLITGSAPCLQALKVAELAELATPIHAVVGWQPFIEKGTGIGGAPMCFHLYVGELTG